MILAVEFEKQTIVDLLLQFGADVNASGGIAGTSLIASLATGNLGIVKQLVEVGADNRK